MSMSEACRSGLSILRSIPIRGRRPDELSRDIAKIPVFYLTRVADCNTIIARAMKQKLTIFIYLIARAIHKCTIK